jgi:hypothetical protein
MKPEAAYNDKSIEEGVSRLIERDTIKDKDEREKCY